MVLAQGYSFKQSSLMEGTYQNFLNAIEHEKYPGTAVIKDFLQDSVLHEKILSQI